MIAASVGKNGRNNKPDVLTVQSLINKCIGYIVPRAPLQTTGACDDIMIDAIKDFQVRVVKLPTPDGRVDPNGRTLEALTTIAAGKTYTPKTAPAPSGTGKKYTTSALEQVTTRTTPTPAEVVNLLFEKWPELNKTGAKVLTAQSMAETGDWKFCFNWNLGNVKAGSGESHMYLSNVWECVASENAQSHVDKAGGSAHIATEDEAKKRGWSCPGKSIVVFQPPHAQCRFKAYNSLAEGAQRWINHHQKIAARDATYLQALNDGDIAAVAKKLKATGYYTANETQYKNAMIGKKAVVDKAVGD